jgi:hypothetical protein
MLNQNQRIMQYKINLFGLENKLKELNKILENLPAKKIKEFGITEVEKFINLIIQSVDFQKLGVYSKANVCSQICKIVSQNLDYESEKIIAHLRENQFSEIFGAKREKQNDTEKQKENDEARKVVNQETYLKTAIDLIKSDNYILQGLGFCALTGRRTIEIFKTGSFSLSDSYDNFDGKNGDLYKAIIRQKHTVIFKGQAKKKDSFESYPIILLGGLTAKSFLSYFKKFRAKCNEKREYKGKVILPISDIDNTKTQLRIGKALELNAKKYFSDFWSDKKTTAKDTRQAYSYIAVYQIFTKDKIFLGVKNRQRNYLQNNSKNRIKLASVLLGHESIAPQEKYFLKLEK